MTTPKPKTPKMNTPVIAPAPALPTISDPAVEEAARKKRAVELNSKGRKSTILTGVSGFEDTTKKKTLLGE